MSLWFFASDNPFNVSCQTIGNCASKTPTLDAGFANATHLITSLIGGLAIIFIIYGAIQFALSGGNAKQVQAAKQTLTYAVIGLVLSIAAYAIVTFITKSL